MKHNVWKKSIASVLLVTLVFTMLPVWSMDSQAKTECSMDEFDEMVSTYNVDDSVPSYKEYKALHADASYPDTVVEIPAAGFVRYEESNTPADPEIYSDYEGMAGDSVLTGEDSLIEFEVDVAQSGLYNLSVVYYPVAGKNSDIQRSMFLDGSLPFGEMALLNFPRVWTNYVADTKVDKNGITVMTWEKDNQGNDVKPKTMEVPEWQTRYLYDSDGYITEPLSVYLEAGKHTVSMVSLREPMLINKLILSNAEEAKSYAEVKAAWDAAGAVDSSGTNIL